MISELRQALDHTAGIVAAVPDDRYGDPTPCPDFDVQTLMNHLVAGNIMFTGSASGDAFDPGVFAQDHLGDDPAGAYRRSAEMVLAAWQRPGALDRTTSFANMAGHQVIMLHMTEALVHGWDLSSATGQRAPMDPKLAQSAYDAITQVPSEMLRSSNTFGAEVPVDAGAPVQDRLVAFLGREPTWKPD